MAVGGRAGTEGISSSTGIPSGAGEYLCGSSWIRNLFVCLVRVALDGDGLWGGGVPPAVPWTKTLTHRPCDPAMGSGIVQVQL